VFPFVSRPSYQFCANHSVIPVLVTVSFLAGKCPDEGRLSSNPGATWKMGSLHYNVRSESAKIQHAHTSKNVIEGVFQYIPAA
jgi:hypothetical protein